MHFIKQKKSIELEKQLQLICETQIQYFSTWKDRKRLIKNRKKRIRRIRKEIEREKVNEIAQEEETLQKITTTLEFFELN